VTPGCSESSAATLRPSSGSARIWLPAITLPMLESVLLITLASATTCTDSDSVPTSRPTVTSLVESTCSATLSITDVLKPWSSALSE
jgi:hypothetical protein